MVIISFAILFLGTTFGAVTETELPDDLDSGWWVSLAERADSLRRERNYSASILLYDSLLSVDNGPESTDRLKYILRSGLSYKWSGDVSEALKRYNSVLDQAKKMGLSRTEYCGHAWLNSGVVYKNMGSVSQAIDSYTNACSIYNDLGIEDMADRCSLSHGILLMEDERYDDALSMITVSAEGFLKRGDDMRLAEAYNTMGNIQQEMSHTLKASSLFSRAEALSRKIEDDALLSSVIHNQGALWLSLGEVDSAASAFRNAIILMKQSDDSNLATAYRNLGLSYQASEDDELALGEFDNAQEIFQSQNDSCALIQIDIDRTKSLVALSELSMANEHLMHARRLLSAHNHKVDFRSYYGAKAQFHMSIEDWSTAIAYRDSHDVTDVHIRKEISLKEVARAQEMFDSNVKDFRIDSLSSDYLRVEGALYESETKRDRLFATTIALSIVISVLALAYLLYSQYRKRKVELSILKVASEVEEQERQRIAMDLHDATSARLWNAKHGIKSIFDADSNSEIASKLEQISDQINLAGEEISRLSNRLSRPKMRDGNFGNTLKGLLIDTFFDSNVHIHFESNQSTDWTNFSEEELIIIYRIVQESLSNARRHAEASEVTLRLEENNRQLVISVIDNGKGFDISDRLPSRRYGGHGLGNMKSRAKAILADYKITSSKSGTGTKADLRLKIKK